MNNWINKIINKITPSRVEDLLFLSPDGRFNGKKVLITGGSSGIGKEIAKQFVSEGATVLITGRNESMLIEACKNIGITSAQYIVWDLALLDTVEEKINECIQRLNGIDIFVNNAGVYKVGNWDEFDESTFDYVESINAKALYRLCVIEAKCLKDANRPGRIINICSMDGLIANFTPYGVSKWEATAITKQIAKMMDGFNIQICGIAPGAVVTNITGKMTIDVRKNAYTRRHPSGRYVLVEEVAQLSLFLAGTTSPSYNGQVIAIDGGTTLFES